MKKATLSAVLSFMLGAAILNMAAPSASAQTDDKQLNAGLDAGKTCLDYTVDVSSLVDNDHRIYWKQQDCVRIHVTNNPFRYTYSATVDEQKVAEDDVVGTLGSLFGLKSISSSTTPQSKPSAAPTGTTPGGEHNLLELRAVTPKQCTKAEEQQLRQQIDLAKVKATELSQQIAASESSLTSLEKGREYLEAALKTKDELYKNFEIQYLETSQFLRNPDSQQHLKEAADKLQRDSLAVWRQLTDDSTFESELVKQFEAAREYKRTLQVFQQEIIKQKEALKKPACTASGDLEKERAGLFDVVTSKINDDLQQTELIAAEIANLTCIYKERKQGEYVWVHDQVYKTVTAVLANPDAFGCTVRREGPFSDPTSAVLTLKRDKILDETEGAIPGNDNSALACVSDPSTVLDPAKVAKTMSNIPAPEAGPSGEKKDTKDNTANNKTDKSTTSKTQEATTIALQQPWIFGRPRLVLSGGLTTGFLAQREYQRSTSASGASVVGSKTDSKERLTPMLYGHVLLPWYARHQSDAFYGTFGVTAKSDNQGTDPEFLLGFSRSVSQQRFFLTLGAYIGKKQKLDGGLQLGQTIPSSLTGELPIAKSYHVGWGFGISYRFASTKDPQKDTSPQNTNSPKKKGK